MLHEELDNGLKRIGMLAEANNMKRNEMRKAKTISGSIPVHLRRVRPEKPISYVVPGQRTRRGKHRQPKGRDYFSKPQTSDMSCDSDDEDYDEDAIQYLWNPPQAKNYINLSPSQARRTREENELQLAIDLSLADFNRDEDEYEKALFEIGNTAQNYTEEREDEMSEESEWESVQSEDDFVHFGVLSGSEDEGEVNMSQEEEFDLCDELDFERMTEFVDFETGERIDIDLTNTCHKSEREEFERENEAVQKGEEEEFVGCPVGCGTYILVKYINDHVDECLTKQYMRDDDVN